MLINSLTAENFRKYHKLEVTDIPASGVITIAGQNESGKTSIGEAICFALYGRTFFLDDKNLHKVICWGRDIAEVTLVFTDGMGDQYRLYRNLHRDGTTEVSLNREISEGVSSIAQVELDTDDAVTAALSKILGFDYDAFSNSFYLAQRELTNPDPQSETIKQMAGIGDYARIANELSESNVTHEQRINELQPQVDTTQAELDAINLDEAWLPELIDAEQTLGTEQQRREALVDHLANNEELYAQNVSLYNRIRRKGRWFRLLSYLMVPLLFITWIAWLIHANKPAVFDNMMEKLSLNEGLANSLGNWLLPLALLSTGLFILGLLINKRTQREAQQLEDEAEEFGISLQEGHRFITTAVESLMPERVVQMLHERSKEKSTLLRIPPREQFANLVQLIEDIPTFKAPHEEVSAAITRLVDALKQQDSEIGDIGKKLLDDIAEEKERSDAAGALRSSLKVLSTELNQCNHQIDVHNMAKDMLRRAARDSIELFNKNIAEISADTLPKFTEGRYSEVRIAEDLSVQVYSDEKKGYMDFDEISSGTQRQIMLAVRMAMSEELSRNSGNEQQFIFLDEPFAFFDQARTKATLAALPEVSNVLTQIWIVAQEFPEDVVADKVINCPSEQAELLV